MENLLWEALLLSKELGLWVNVELKGLPLFALTPRTKGIVDCTVALIRDLGMK